LISDGIDVRRILQYEDDINMIYKSSTDVDLQIIFDFLRNLIYMITKSH
jgi:hypothetical protein